MVDRPKGGGRAILVHLPATEDNEGLYEFRQLAKSAGVEQVGEVSARRPNPNPRFFIGTGRLAELAEAVSNVQADLVLFNQPLNASQERNLEKHLRVRVLDRTELILDIFAQRAQTFEGKLQVELAQLKHLATRLVRGWAHLERQKGGIGMRGPGETQLETDQRLIGGRIAQIEKRLSKVEQQRNRGRVARKKSNIPVVAIVGYTNAGKSTLFNALTGASVLAEDKVFATLDPTRRRLSLGNALDVILTDTVGFIRGIPHELIAAFRSTLQEAADADLLLHVIDLTDARMAETMDEVVRVLDDIGAGAIPRLEIYNKADEVEEAPVRHEERNGAAPKVWISARRGDDIVLVREAIGHYFSRSARRRVLHFDAGHAQLRARLYRVANVLREDEDGLGGWEIEVEVDDRNEYLVRAVEAEM